MKANPFYWTVAALGLVGILGTGCVHTPGDKCYVPPKRYNEMKQVFLDTGSMQRVEQEMETLEWAECEREQLRYQLAKELRLDGAFE
ncbi:MAG: hypothetical protein SFY68_08195 [Candidatus Sumerlaeia bacterium]|nr:hypothetical protein [Candidatus Sumerlaeia bacterium]